MWLRLVFGAGSLPWLLLPLMLVSFVLDFIFGLGVLLKPSGKHLVGYMEQAVCGDDGHVFNVRLYYPAAPSNNKLQKKSPYFLHGTLTPRGIAR